MLYENVKELERENWKLRQQIAELGRRIEEKTTKPQSCKYCAYYLQHYIKEAQGYCETNCGHCIHGRVKERKPDASCQYFKLGAFEMR